MDHYPYLFFLLIVVVFVIIHIRKLNCEVCENAGINNIFECLNDGVIVIDTKEKIKIINNEAKSILGLEDRVYRGLPLNSLKVYDKLTVLTETLKKGKVYKDYEVVINNKKLRFDTAQFCNVPPPVKGAKNKNKGSVIGAILFIKDITDKKKWEEQFYQAEKMAIVGELAAGIAHEIRNPLTSVRGFVQLVGQKYRKENKNEAGFVAVVQNELDRINKIITDFINFARPTKANLQIIDLGTVVKEVTSILKNEADVNNIQITIKENSILPFLILDAGQIKQVFLNLMTNAMSAMPHGGKLDIILEYSEAEKVVEIKVSDTGTGISQEIMDKIFEPFYTTKERGTGLGMAVTYTIIKNHGGTIDVESELGKGTTFIIKLPAGNFTDR